MTWELEIHTIDVGQGESSLIVARNTALGQQRSMLIDGGLASYAKTVHNYITQHARLTDGVDHILVSHYDTDHSNGIQALLLADNLSRVCDELAHAAGAAAAAAAGRNRVPNQQIAAAAAAVNAAIKGAYGDYAKFAINAGKEGEKLTFLQITSEDEVADEGAKEGLNILFGPDGSQYKTNTLLVYSRKAKLVYRAAAKAAGKDPGDTRIQRTDKARKAVFEVLSTTVSGGSRFDTGGIYQNAHIIDIGDTSDIDNEYTNIIDGKYLQSANNRVKAPEIQRQRTQLDVTMLGHEIFWNTGVKANPPPKDEAPALFVVACQKYIWNAPNGNLPISSGQSSNDDSIGLILRFNHFFYYTGGDLPSNGEDLIAKAIMGNGLPNPDPAVGGTLKKPHRIACFKCGHHGSKNSTSQHFLDTVQPSVALLSCGENQFGTGDNHPEQNVINRLHSQDDIQFFYLTNCNYITPHIPASNGEDQLSDPKNKSRVAGKLKVPNLKKPEGERGNIKLFINQNESESKNVSGPLQQGEVLRQFHIQYWEEDVNPIPPGYPIGMRTESIIF